MALHWVQGICFLLVAVVRVCQTIDASQEGEGARTQTTQHVVQVLIATQDLVTCALMRVGSVWGERGGKHCPSVCSRALPVPRSVALYLHCKSLYIRGTRVSLYSCIWVDGIHVVCVCVRARHFSSSFLPHCDIITTVGMQTKLIFLFLIRV